MNAKTDPSGISKDSDRQAQAEAERAKAALDNVREGYDKSPLSSGGAAPDPTPHGQVPESQRSRGGSPTSD
ncbi:hypothetical protein [Rhizobacter sp. LjRoot28]|jgi:hypothetical protein|uniref:hypothetical protein n=1 Tax=Rhizobacter sp. LjRoot28 TaxID=3342309 RepID=UPI003ECFC56E